MLVALVLPAACSSSSSSDAAGSTGSQGGADFDGVYIDSRETVCRDRADLWEQVLRAGGPAVTSGTGGGTASSTGHGGDGGALGAGGGGGAGEAPGGEGGGAGGAADGGGGFASDGVPPGCPDEVAAAPFVSNPNIAFGFSVSPPVLVGSECCYEIGGTSVVSGRPMRVHGRAVMAPPAGGDGWRFGGVPDVARRAAAATTVRDRVVVADAWLAVARMEHASVASFARLILELLALGAPADLVADAQRAGLDEVRHANDAFAVASAYRGGDPIGPGAMPDLSGLRVSCVAEDVVTSTVIDGCVDETLAAFEVAEQATLAGPGLRDLLADIADDETRHAALAWRVVRWALAERRVEAAHVRHAFAGAIEVARRRLEAGGLARGPSQLAEHGLLPPERRERLHRDVLARIERLASDLVGPPGGTASVA